MNQLLTMLLTSEMNRSADTPGEVFLMIFFTGVADVGNEPIGGHLGPTGRPTRQPSC